MRGKRKVGESNTEDKKDGRAYFAWNLEMERALAEVLRDQRSLGNKSDGGWKSAAYNTAAEVLSSRYNVPLIGENVKNHVKLWRAWYGTISDILSQSGFDWDGTKYMITVSNEDAWNEYAKSHVEAKRFRYKVIPNWDDIVDLCAKDRATGIGAETALDADDIMSKEAYSVDVDADELSSTSRKVGQSSNMQSRKGKGGEKDGIVASMNRVAESLNEFVQLAAKRVKNVEEVAEVAMNELQNVPDLNASQWLSAVDWLSENPNKLSVLKALPIERKKDYILAYLQQGERPSFVRF